MNEYYLDKLKDSISFIVHSDDVWYEGVTDGLIQINNITYYDIKNEIVVKHINDEKYCYYNITETTKNCMREYIKKEIEYIENITIKNLKQIEEKLRN